MVDVFKTACAVVLKWLLYEAGLSAGFLEFGDPEPRFKSTAPQTTASC